MNQNMIYRLENPSYGRATISTLKRIAAVFDVALVVRFVPFSQLIDWVTGTPFEDKGLSPEALAVPGFSDVRLGSIPQDINKAAQAPLASRLGLDAAPRSSAASVLAA